MGTKRRSRGAPIWRDAPIVYAPTVNSYTHECAQRLLDPFLRLVMGNVNRKATDAEMDHVRRVVSEAYPEYQAVFGGHSAYEGRRAPRDHAISFRLRDATGKYRSNVVWLMPDRLSRLTPGHIRAMVVAANGRREAKKRRS